MLRQLNSRCHHPSTYPIWKSIHISKWAHRQETNGCTTSRFYSLMSKSRSQRNACHRVGCCPEFWGRKQYSTTQSTSLCPFVFGKTLIPECYLLNCATKNVILLPAAEAEKGTLFKTMYVTVYSTHPDKRELNKNQTSKFQIMPFSSLPLWQVLHVK